MSRVQLGSSDHSSASSSSSKSETPLPSGIPKLPRCESMQDVERLHGRRVVILGRYEVEPIPGGKKLQAVAIVLSDGTRLVRSYRPVPGEYHFFNARVVVVGTVFRDAGLPPTDQQLLAPHVRPERIALASGEASSTTKITELPPPPVVTTASELDAQPDRWVQAFGTLASVAPRADDENLASAVLNLTDGTPVTVRTVSHSRWALHIGQHITAVGRTASPTDPPGRSLTARVALCPGHVQRCDVEAAKRGASGTLPQ